MTAVTSLGICLLLTIVSNAQSGSSGQNVRSSSATDILTAWQKYWPRGSSRWSDISLSNFASDATAVNSQLLIEITEKGKLGLKKSFNENVLYS